MNQIRGLLREYGVVVAQGKGALEQALPALLEDGEHGLTVTCLQQAGGSSLSRYAVAEWQALDARMRNWRKILRPRSSRMSRRGV